MHAYFSLFLYSLFDWHMRLNDMSYEYKLKWISLYVRLYQRGLYNKIKTDSALESSVQKAA